MSETGEQGPIKETSLPQAEAQISQQEPAPTHTASVENVEVPGGDHGQSVEALGLAPIPQATKLRRECLSVAEKDALCKFKQDNPAIRATALKEWAKEQFGKEPSSSQISRILQEPEKWSTKEGRLGARKVRHGKWPTLEQALNIVFAQERQSGQNITATTILKKARELAPELGIRDFTGSNTWAENFRNRSRFNDAKAIHIPTMTQVLNAPPDSDTVMSDAIPGPTIIVPPDLDINTVRQEIMNMHRVGSENTSSLQNPESHNDPGSNQAHDESIVIPQVQSMQNLVSLEEAHHAAFLIASCMEQNPEKFSVPEQLHFEKVYRAKLAKFLIDKMQRPAN